MKKLLIVFIVAFLLALGYMLHSEFVRELLGVMAGFVILLWGLALIIRKGL